MLWLTLAESADGNDLVGRLGSEIETLGRLAADLNLKLREAGIDGLEGALGLSQRVQDVLDSIGAGDLAEGMASVQALVGRLESLLRRLAAVRQIKDELG